MSQDAKIGIGVGVPLGLALLAVIGLLIYRERRNKEKIAGQQISMGFRVADAEYRPPAEFYYEAPTQKYPHEAPADMTIYEAP
jgi:hypothetical protein